MTNLTTPIDRTLIGRDALSNGNRKWATETYATAESRKIRNSFAGAYIAGAVAAGACIAHMLGADIPGIDMLGYGGTPIAAAVPGYVITRLAQR